MLGSADPFIRCSTWIIFHHSYRLYSNLCGLFISNLNCTPSGLSNRPSGHGQKAQFFFVAIEPPQKKSKMGFCHKNGDFTLNTMKNLRLFFHLSTFRISPTRGYDRCLLVCSQSTGFFICRYKPFTIYNKPVFLNGFYIYLWDITVYWYV